MEMFPAFLSLETKTNLTAIATTSCQNISQKDEKRIHEKPHLKNKLI